MAVVAVDSAAVYKRSQLHFVLLPKDVALAPFAFCLVLLCVGGVLGRGRRAPFFVATNGK